MEDMGVASVASSLLAMLLCSLMVSSTTAKISVHLVPHTHNDVGWLKTVDQYFYGANNTIQNAGVQYILDSVIEALADHPERKFIYVETGFFKRWWDQQDKSKKDQVTSLVETKQLQFVNGGWCMSDEAAPLYVDMIDQQTLGHQFLLQWFGPEHVPTVGWQIDPFGHSAFMGTAYALMGMDSWFFGRIDYQDFQKRHETQTMETVVRTSQSLGNKGDILEGALDAYGPPPGFSFDVKGTDSPVCDNPDLHDMNVDQRVEDFVQAALKKSREYQTDHIMFTMGEDFTYQSASHWFVNLDKLIKYVNADGRVETFYSTPTEYTAALYAANQTWPSKTDDWFPYADSPHSVWTGYFTSRPALKLNVRTMSNFLQVCRQMDLLMGDSDSSLQLWESMSLAQHHDAVSGTAKQHTTEDYAQRISAGYEPCKASMTKALSNLLSTPLEGLESVEITHCPLLNETNCPATQAMKNTLGVVLWNPLAQSQAQYIRLPVPDEASLTVVEAESQTEVESHMYTEGGSTFLIFEAQVPALGYAAYNIEDSKRASNVREKPNTRVPNRKVGFYRSEESGDSEITIFNDRLSISFSTTSGLMTRIKDYQSGLSTSVQQYWGYYEGSNGSTVERPNQASGAYIMRPNCPEDTTEACKPDSLRGDGNYSASLQLVETPLGMEVHQIFSDWVTQVVRLEHQRDYAQIEYTVGPIPIDDGIGKEVVQVWSTDLRNDQTFYTDSNGRDMQQRKVNFRPTWDLNVTDPVSSNFYPVTTAVSMVDSSGSGSSARELSIVVDRAQAVGSHREGELQIMPHRRLLFDDNRGVGEALNETIGCGNSCHYPNFERIGVGLQVRAMQHLSFSDVESGPRLRKVEQERMISPLVPFFVSQAVSLKPTSMLKNDFPQNLRLLSLHDNSVFDGTPTAILRLAHLFEAGEDSELSEPVQIDISDLFSNFTLKNCTEMQLSAALPLDQVQRLDWKSDLPSIKSANSSSTIAPMDIRTWKCKY